MELDPEGSMRVPARSIAALAAFVAAWSCASCVTSSPVEVAYDAREDLSRFRTWDWIEGGAVHVRAPFHDAAQLESKLAALLESELRERGLERAPGRGELRVAALLVVKRTYHTFRAARAMQTLHSYHDIGSFEVQVDELEQRPVDLVRLAVYVTGARQQRRLWRAELDERHVGGFAPHLDDAVANLLDRFPPRAQRNGSRVDQSDPPSHEKRIPTPAR